MTDVGLHELIVQCLNELPEDTSFDQIAGHLSQRLLAAGLILSEASVVGEHQHDWYLASEKEMFGGKIERIYRCGIDRCSARTRMVGPEGRTPFDPI